MVAPVFFRGVGLRKRDYIAPVTPVVFRDYNGAAQGSSTIGMPAAAVSGDTLIAHVFADGSIATFAGGTGWTQLTTVASTGVNAISYQIWSGVFGTAATFSLSGSGSSKCGIIQAFYNVGSISTTYATYNTDTRTLSPSSFTVAKGGSALSSGHYAWQSAPTGMSGGGGAAWTETWFSALSTYQRAFYSDSVPLGTTSSITMSGGDTSDSVVGGVVLLNAA